MGREEHRHPRRTGTPPLLSCNTYPHAARSCLQRIFQRQKVSSRPPMHRLPKTIPSPHRRRSRRRNCSATNGCCCPPLTRRSLQALHGTSRSSSPPETILTRTGMQSPPALDGLWAVLSTFSLPSAQRGSASHSQINQTQTRYVTSFCLWPH